MENIALATEVFSNGGLEIGGVRIDFVHLFEFPSVHPFEYGSDSDINRTEQKRNFSVIKFPLVEEVAGDGVGVVDLSRIFSRVSDRGERVVAEYDRVVLLQEPCMEKDSVLQIELTETSGEFAFTERDTSPGKSHGTGVESVRTEKERREIGTE